MRKRVQDGFNKFRPRNLNTQEQLDWERDNLLQQKDQEHFNILNQEFTNLDGYRYTVDRNIDSLKARFDSLTQVMEVLQQNYKSWKPITHSQSFLP